VNRRALSALISAFALVAAAGFGTHLFLAGEVETGTVVVIGLLLLAAVGPERNEQLLARFLEALHGDLLYGVVIAIEWTVVMTAFDAVLTMSGISERQFDLLVSFGWSLAIGILLAALFVRDRRKSRAAEQAGRLLTGD